MPSLEIKGKKAGIIFGFRGKNQLPLFMIIKEYFDENGDVDFAKVLFERWKDKVTYWITVNEINVLGGYWTLGLASNNRKTGSHSNQGETPLEDAGIKFQSIHHMLVASSMANKMAREINPHFMLGTMCALSGIYPST